MDWKAKVLIQFVLAKLPAGEHLNYGLQVMLGRYTPLEMRKRLIERLLVFERLQKHAPLRGATIVEMGTGWELLDPILMCAFGAKRVYTFDQHSHLRFPVAKLITQELRELSPPGTDPKRTAALASSRSLPELLEVAGITYIAPGDASQTGLPDSSVDVVYSRAVLEHVLPRVITALIAESRRILKPSGIGFHIIDPGDHYAELGVSKVNFLRYSDRAWNFWVQNKISFHNRLRGKQFLDIFAEQGAHLIELRTKTEASDVALLREGFKMDKRFHQFTPEESAVYNVELVHNFKFQGT